MLLKDYFYKIRSEKRGEGLQAVYSVAILPDCAVYEGHFPGNPVCPGVCNIQTILECAMMLTGERLAVHTIKLCRLTAIATPEVCPLVDIAVEALPVEHGYAVTAKIYDSRQTFMEMKGHFTKKA